MGKQNKMPSSNHVKSSAAAEKQIDTAKKVHEYGPKTWTRSRLNLFTLEQKMVYMLLYQKSYTKRYMVVSRVLVRVLRILRL